jgi:hypothetical protein
MNRVTTALHSGKPILQLDFDGCVPGSFAPVIAEAQRTIQSAPKGSLLVLTCVENVRFDGGTVVEMQRFAAACMPYLKANAIVGITGMKKVVFGGIRPLYRVPLELFDDRGAARDWLAAR